ncbi:ras guanine nucleotide exchange factor domain-containing protein [Spinellus fusiger]|nr:ras guanine nucleotide exchange factor domain-containing protein [Spinellus fusiger]
MAKCTRNRHSLVVLTYSLVGSQIPPATPSPCSFSTLSQQPSRRPSLAPSLLSFVTNVTPPDSPITLGTSPPSLSNTPLLLLYEAKEIAQYLTLADFYLLKCTTPYDYLRGQWRHQHQEEKSCDYISLMTQRANMVTHWVSHEICTLKTPKQRKAGLRKMIEISKTGTTSIQA